MTIVFSGFWFVESNLYKPLPDRISDLEEEQITYNEKLITAQILSEKMDNVYSVFENNMALKDDNALKEDASIEFLNNLTDILNKLGITVLHIKPGVKEERATYTFIPYELEIECTFEKFGNLITELEKNKRLISIDEFLLNNGLERLALSKTREALMNEVIKMKISTVTLNKSRG